MPHKGIEYQNLMAFCMHVMFIHMLWQYSVTVAYMFIHMLWQYSVTVALMFIKTELCIIVTVRRQFEMK